MRRTTLGLTLSISLLVTALTLPFYHWQVIVDVNAAGITTSMKGMTINAWSAEAYNSSDFDQSITNLAGLKANWVTLTVFWFMERYNDTEMHRRPDLYTASDSSLMHAIQKAQELGMKVALKPMVDVVDGTWRGQIQPTNWTLWFANYTDFINYYADFAETNNAELLVVGTEFRSSQSYESEWRQVISEVRTRFSMNITYAANWDSYNTNWVKFWDALDYIGVDAYFPLTNSFNPTLSQLKNAWSYSTRTGYVGRNWTNELYSTYIQTGKEIVFTEIGYCSQNGTNTQPWNWNVSPTVDLQEQADCYQAALEVFKDKTWFEGWFWWNWETDPDAGKPGTPDEKHYTPQNKPAQDTLMQYYYEPDIAVTNVVCSKMVVEEGTTINVTVSVENQGIYTETFNLTLYANTTSIAQKTVTLSSENQTNVVYAWNTTGFAIGNYTINAYAWPLQGEADIDDNLYPDGTVQIVPYSDIALTNITFSKSCLEINERLHIFVTIENRGSLNETFDVGVNYTQITDPLIGTKTITLNARKSAVLNFTWTPNSTGRFEIKAYTSTIQNDINPLDNTKTSYVCIVSVFEGGGGSEGWQTCYK